MSVTTDPSQHPHLERETGVYHIDITRSVAHVIVAAGEETKRAENVVAIFGCVARAGVPIFLAKLHGHEVSFAMEADRLADVEGALTDAGHAYRTLRDLAIVTVHANTMRDLTGVLVRIADALQLAGSRMYGAGDSHSTVHCLIDGHRSDAALLQLRHAFGVELPDAHA